MDVYHKVLLRIYEITGGRETEDVDFVELLKKEGFFPSLDSIKAHMATESWITDSPREKNVRITHWGVAEARKAKVASSGTTEPVERQANRLLSETREFAIELEEFAVKPSASGLKIIEKRYDGIGSLIDKIKGML
jgi:hypothetical protein